MRTRKKGWIAGVAVAGVAVAATSVTVGLSWAQAGGKGDKAEAPDCEINRLEGDYGDASAVSPSGEFIVGSVHTEDHAEADKSAAIWKDGKLEDLMPQVTEAIPESSSAEADVVNDAGTVVGATMDFDEENKGFRIQDGRTEVLTGPEGYPMVTRIAAMNADGTVIGQASQGEMGDEIPVVWEAGDTEATQLGDADLTVTDIADDGTIFGQVADPDSDENEVVSKAPDGEFEPIGMTGADFTQPVVSGDWLLAGDYRLNLAEGGEPEKHELAGGESVYPNAAAINANGAVYGEAEEGVAAVGVDGETVELPQTDEDYQVQPLPELTSDDGSVVAGFASNGDDEHQVHHPYVWNCS